MSSTEPTPSKEFYVHIGAPEPIIVRLRSAGVLLAFDSSLKFTYVNDAGTVTLGVGSGITLSTDEAIANARATIQLTVAQSRAIPVGSLTRYEIQQTVGGLEKIFMMGSLIGEGGDNPDG
jgi:hypothetical protein